MSEFTTPQNPLYRRNSVVKFDNDFVSHSIPRSDTRYPFILQNLVRSAGGVNTVPIIEGYLPNGYLIGGFSAKEDILGSLRYYEEGELFFHNWLSLWQLGYIGIAGHGLYPAYLPPEFQGFSIDDRTVYPENLTLFFANRSLKNFWDKRRGHHFTAYDRNNNIVSVSDPEELIISGQRYIEKKPAIKTYQVSPVSDRYFPIEQASMVALNENLGIFVPTEMKYTLGNNFGLYGISSLDQALGVFKEEDFVYERVKRSYAQDPSKFGTIKYREKIYPKESNVFLNRTRTRPDPLFWFWSEDRTFYSIEINKILSPPSDPNVTSFPVLWPTDTFINEEIEYVYDDPASLNQGVMLEFEVLAATTEGLRVNEQSLTEGRAIIDNLCPHTLQDFYVTFRKGVPLTFHTGVRQDSYINSEMKQGCYFRRVFSYINDTFYSNEIENFVYSPLKDANPDFPLAVFEGTTVWNMKTTDKTGAIVNLKPFYDRFKDNSAEIKLIHKNKSVLPEFKISDHLPYYFDSQSGNFLGDPVLGNFSLNSSFPEGLEKSLVRAEFNEEGNVAFGQFLSENHQKSSNLHFFDQYVATNNMSKYSTLREDHVNVASPTRLKLVVRGIKKFFPNSNFYPIEAASELSRLFSEGVLLNSIGVINTSTDENSAVDDAPDFIRPIEAALFGPGIFYNTIKSGTAVSSRVRTANKKWTSITGETVGAAADPQLSVHYMNYHRLSKDQMPEQIVPFEALLEPEKYLANKIIHDNEIHPYSRPGVGSGKTLWNGTGHYKYKLAMHNFLAETSSLFTDGTTSFLSSPESGFKVMKSGKEYRMRVVLRTSEFRTIEQIVSSNSAFFSFDSETGQMSQLTSNFLVTAPSTLFSRPTISIFDRPHFDNNLLEGSDGLPNRGAYEHAGSAFGPPHVQIAPTVANATSYTPRFFYGAQHYDGDSSSAPPLNHKGISYDAWTPPHQQGYAHAEISFVAFDGTRQYTIEEIFENSTVTFKRWGSFPANVIDPTVYDQNTDLPMQLSSTVDLFSVDRESIGERSKDRWRIGLKFETPIFDWTDVDSLSTTELNGVLPVGYHSSSRGPWLQYGKDIIDPDKGLFLEIMDSPDVTSNYGSLADIINIKPSKKRVGELPFKKKISEAVVMVPYVIKDGERKFLGIDRSLIDGALVGADGVGESIKHLVSAMPKYVIPPKMNFLLYDGKDGRSEVDPIAMYFFEFDYDLEREDLKRIWHNVMPTNADKFEEQEVVIEHELLPGEVLSEYIDDDLKWMVFKVKQKAATNYYEAVGKTGDLEVDIDGNTVTPEYSYNWPYDNLSIVEMAEVEAEVLFEKPEDTEKRRSGAPEPFDIRDPLPSTDGLFGNTTKLYNKLSPSLTSEENS